MVSAIFLFDNFFLVSLERNDLYLTFKSKTSAVFDVTRLSQATHIAWSQATHIAWSSAALTAIFSQQPV